MGSEVELRIGVQQLLVQHPSGAPCNESGCRIMGFNQVRKNYQQKSIDNIYYYDIIMVEKRKNL
jgi:hypothetical protein